MFANPTFNRRRWSCNACIPLTNSVVGWRACHTYIRHTYIHYIHTYIHTCMHTYTHTYIHTYILVGLLSTSRSSSCSPPPTGPLILPNGQQGQTGANPHFILSIGKVDLRPPDEALEAELTQPTPWVCLAISYLIWQVD